jgi:hypothetical protein
VPCGVVCCHSEQRCGLPRRICVATTHLLFVMIGLAQSFPGGKATIVNLIILVVILLILFGGGGFYYGGPYVGGGLERCS